jgi:hypothetical protein
VLDSADVLADPERALRALCAALALPFIEGMLLADQSMPI